MPSPLAHSVVGFSVAKILLHHVGPGLGFRNARNLGLLFVTIIVSLLPDFDTIFGIIFNDVGKYHNNISHSLLFGVVVSLLVGSLIFLLFRRKLGTSIITTFISYEIHILMDFFTDGRGVMLFWPFTEKRFQSGIYLFHGLHWGDGLVSQNHLITLINEGLFIVILFVILKVGLNKTTKSCLAEPEILD